MKEEVKIKWWIIFEKFGRDEEPYILDLSNENVNSDEIALCVQEQVYGGENE